MLNTYNNEENTIHETVNETMPAAEKKCSKRRSHKNGARAITALALACTLIGGTAGGAIGAGIAGKNSDTSVQTTSAESSSALQVNTLSTSSTSSTGSMTPEEIYANNVNAVVAIANEGTTTNIFGQTSETASSGSGFIVSSDGYIVTNNHVVAGAQSLTVTMTNGDTYDATVIGADEENDVALIKIDASDLPTVTLGDSDQLAVGEQVCAIGNPLGELTNTLTVGYVSALDREIEESSDAVVNMFQTDCAINAGNSGGPLFDSDGNVVGITTAKYSSSGSTSSASIEGIGFCIPINDAMDIVKDLMQYGYVRDRASLGITCQSISDSVTQYYNLPAGVYVNSVNDGSAAANAGIEQGDIITKIGDTDITSVTDLKAELKNYKAGDTAELTVYRSGQTTQVEVTLDEKTETSEAATEQDSTDSSSDAAQQFESLLPGMFGYSSGSSSDSGESF